MLSHETNLTVSTTYFFMLVFFLFSDVLIMFPLGLKWIKNISHKDYLTLPHIKP